MTEANRYANGAAFIDGEYKPIEEAKISVLDWGFIRSDVTFDVVHVWDGSFFRLQDHLARFKRSCEGLRMDPGLTSDGIAEVLQEIVRMSGLRNAYVEFGCTRGLPVPGSRDPRSCTNRFYAHAIPFIWIANEEQRARGLKLWISDVLRVPAESINPLYKNYNRGDFTAGLFQAFEHGAETCILVDRDGNVTEGPGFNVFAVKDGQVHTPASGVLEGITRRTVMELCEEAGLPLHARGVPADFVRSADECFLSSTAGGVMAVTEVDGKPLGTGTEGPVTARLRELYWSKKAAGWHGTPVRYS